VEEARKKKKSQSIHPNMVAISGLFGVTTSQPGKSGCTEGGTQDDVREKKKKVLLKFVPTPSSKLAVY